MKRKFGDRKDGTLVRNLDSMHYIVPMIYPNRCDNEAYISERIDLTNINEYLKKKNADNPAYKYNLFQVIVTAMLRTIMLRPKMNRFIANKNMYQRKELTAAFTVKKVFTDEGGEALAILHAKEDFNIDTVHEKIFHVISSSRSEKKDQSTEAMDLFNKMPRFLSKFLVWVICRFERHGWLPQALIGTDPYYASVLLSNLGSIKLRCGYHHLTNWGTTSVFCVIGEKKKRPFYDENGNMEMRESVDLGLTIDERIADGYYYSKTIRLLKKLLENPELLEQPFCTEVDY